MDFNLLVAGKPLLLEPGARIALTERMRALSEQPIISADKMAAFGHVRVQHLPGGIGLIPVVGMIGLDWWTIVMGGTSPDGIASALREAVNDPGVDTILMLFDSPGGTVDLLSETANLIREVGSTKRVVGIVRPFCASAAYWLAAQCGELVCTPSGEVGSVGAYKMHVDQSALNQRVGIAPTYIFSSVSPFKVEGNPHAPLSREALAQCQREVDNIGEQFVFAVARGRKLSYSAVLETFGKGRMLSAREAFDVGMIDRIETLEMTTSRVWAKRGTSRSSSRSQADIDAEMILVSFRDD